MKVSLVAALAENRVIGAKGGLPWSLPDDMRRFMSLTMGHCVIMGRKTFDSMDRRPLPKRTNIVLSRGQTLKTYADRVHLVADLPAALAIALEEGEDEAFVIGGEAIYALALPQADRLYLTRVHAEVPGEVRFPEFNEFNEFNEFDGSDGSDPSDGSDAPKSAAPAKVSWKLAKKEYHGVDERHAYAFTFEDWVRA